MKPWIIRFSIPFVLIVGGFVWYKNTTYKSDLADRQMVDRDVEEFYSIARPLGFQSQFQLALKRADWFKGVHGGFAGDQNDTLFLLFSTPQSSDEVISHMQQLVKEEMIILQSKGGPYISSGLVTYSSFNDYLKRALLYPSRDRSSSELALVGGGTESSGVSGDWFSCLTRRPLQVSVIASTDPNVSWSYGGHSIHNRTIIFFRFERDGQC